MTAPFPFSKFLDARWMRAGWARAGGRSFDALANVHGTRSGGRGCGRRGVQLRALWATVAVVAVAAGCSSGSPAGAPSEESSVSGLGDAGPTISARSDGAGATGSGDRKIVVMAAGDVACDPANTAGNEAGRRGEGDVCRHFATAALIEAQAPDAVLALGDLQYELGLADAFERSYDPTWGRFKDITYPVPGNHEYGSGGQGYFEYFGARAGEPGKGWYSFDLGDWHFLAINSNCGAVGGCGPDSPQYRWIVEDLTAREAECTVAYWHHPRFSSGLHGDDAQLGPIWELLYDNGVDLVLTGHDHNYERFAPMDASGAGADGGMRSFVVGTGGKDLRPMGKLHSTSEAHNTEAAGVLKLELGDGSYRWEFLPVPGESYHDSGQGRCR
ncbi:MAG: metallophosphoesterase [Acidimicrobiales bacterium]|nr:metallophosphoesterase [Acidimicrobiales bacterium]